MENLEVALNQKKIAKIKNFDGYYVTDKGTVFSIKKFNFINPIYEWTSRLGYKKVSLYNNNQCVSKFTHIIVLESFLHERPLKMQCRHLDGNPSNNELKNLKWGTLSENQMDRVAHNTDNRGSKHGMSKLKIKDVLKIRALAKKYNKNVRKCDLGAGYKKIAKIFKISPSTVGSIVRKEIWKWIDDR